VNLVADVIDPRARWRAIAGTWRSPATLWLKLYRTGHYTLGSSQPASRPFAGRGIDGDADDGRRVVMKGLSNGTNAWALLRVARYPRYSVVTSNLSFLSSRASLGWGASVCGVERSSVATAAGAATEFDAINGDGWTSLWGCNGLACSKTFRVSLSQPELRVVEL